MYYKMFYLPVFDEPFDPIIVLVQTGDNNIFWRHNKILAFLNQRVEMIIVAFILRISVNAFTFNILDPQENFIVNYLPSQR